MGMILKIAWHELKLLFCSPIAWLLLIVFSYQFGTAFSGKLLAANPEILKFLPGYTNWLFSTEILPMVDGKIYLYIPLMTMGLISQELSTGNIKLLFSSPLKTSTILIGKYFGIMGYWLIVILLFSLISIPSYFMISDLDLGVVFPGILAIFLLACTYSAIGIFMSCLTQYQVVAALGTLATLAALNFIGEMWQGVPVLKDIVNFLHMAGHAESMNTGFIKSKDVLYFIIMSILFLGLAVFYIEDTINSRTKIEKIKRYLFFIVLMLGLGCVFSLRSMTLYWDTTAIKYNTISTSSQATLAKIKGAVQVTAYANLLDNSLDRGAGMPENRKKDFNFWEPYIRFLPQLELKYVNYYNATRDIHYTTPLQMDSSAMYVAVQNGWYVEDFLKPDQISHIIDLNPEDFTFVRSITHENKQRFLRVFADFYHVPFEQEIMTAFNGVVNDYPKVGFLTGHYERSITNNEDRAYKNFINERTDRNSLINKGFDVRNVSVKDDFPKDLNALVIAEPLTAFSTLELSKIMRYIEEGNNVLITGGPKCQEILNPLTQKIGVSFLKGQLVQKNKDFSNDMLFANTPLREGGDQYEFQFIEPIAMPAAIGLQYNQNLGFKVEKAVVTDENSTWNQVSEIPTDSSKISYHPENGDYHGELPVALSLTRNINDKQQRIMIVGNGSFMSNENQKRDYKKMPLSNDDFAVTTFKWVTNSSYPITVATLASSKDVNLMIEKEKFEEFSPYYIWTFPGMLLLIGAIFLFKRRRK